MQFDIEKGLHAYVHYFTLYDERARGFVRPMCLAYVSRDARKLQKYFLQIQKEFCLVSIQVKRIISELNNQQKVKRIIVYY